VTRKKINKNPKKYSKKKKKANSLNKKKNKNPHFLFPCYNYCIFFWFFLSLSSISETKKETHTPPFRSITPIS
jgi:hypothetical protein